MTPIRFLFAFLACCCFLSHVTSSSSSTSTSKPNIIFVVIDDLGHFDVGFTGSEIPTPNMDALSKEGIKLNNYYVQPLCSPTRSAFLTGRYPIRTGLQHMVIKPPKPFGLPLNETTLANSLKEIGYKTHIVGKWHLGFFQEAYTPLFRGFDTQYGYYLGAGDHFNHTREFTVGGASSIGLDWRDGQVPKWEEQGTYATHLLTKRAVEVIRDHDPNQGGLFMYLPYMAIHEPLQAPANYISRCAHISEPKRQLTCAMVNCVDEGIKNVTDALKRYNLWNNTILVVTTDNGGPVNFAHYNWPLRGGKGTVFEGGTKAVGFLLVNFLKKVSNTYNGLMHGVDWYPTLLKMAGHPKWNGTNERPLDGINQWESITQNLPSKRTEILYNDDPIFKQAAIRVGDWKLISGHPCYSPGTCCWPKPNSTWSLESKFGLFDLKKEGEKFKIWIDDQWDDESERSQGDGVEEEEGKKKRKRNVEDSCFNLLKTTYLFNLAEDPTESNDLSKVYPDKVAELKARLAVYQQQAVVPLNKGLPDDPQANPALHGGVWGPWR